MAILIKDGQAQILSEKISVLQDKCVVRFNEDIKVGMIWNEFVSCQIERFRFLGKEIMESGDVSIFSKNDESLRVHVSKDGRILRWYITNPSL